MGDAGVAEGAVHLVGDMVLIADRHGRGRAAKVAGQQAADLPAERRAPLIKQLRQALARRKKNERAVLYFRLQIDAVGVVGIEIPVGVERRKVQLRAKTLARRDARQRADAHAHRPAQRLAVDALYKHLREHQIVAKAWPHLLDRSRHRSACVLQRPRGQHAPVPIRKAQAQRRTGACAHKHDVRAARPFPAEIGRRSRHKQQCRQRAKRRRRHNRRQ